MKPKSKKYSVIESFVGAGGMALGLKNAGFDTGIAFDNDKPSIDTFNGYFGGHGIVADALSVKGKDLLKMAKTTGRLDLFAGGPPCQGFSKQRKGAYLLQDPRNMLILEYIRLVEEMKPRFFLFENVAVFGQKRGKALLQEMELRLTDYLLYPHFYNSADYGVAQTRQRFILVGKHKDVKAPFKIPAPTVTKRVTIGEAFRGIPEPPEDYTVHKDFPNHQRAKVTDINIKRFSYVPQGGGWQNIPEELRLPSHKRVDTSSGGWPDVYGRLSLSGQAPTITGGFDSFTRGRYGHPIHNRPITPREAARIQGFPDDFAFSGNRGDVRSQIGNAVPPPLAEAIGREIMRTLMIEDGLIKDEGTEPEAVPFSPQTTLIP
jgi:DNA (cytosine-5)-methyltransferase 1